MALFICLAGVALALKLIVFSSGRGKEWADKKWMCLLLTYAAFNAAEFVMYLSLYYELISSHLIKIYFICSVLCLTASFDYVANNKYVSQRIAVMILYSASVLLCIAIGFSDLIIGAYIDNSMPIKSEKGQMFFLYLGFALLSISLIITTLIMNYKKASSVNLKVDYAYTLVAFIPLALAIILILSLMALGFNSNGSAIIPLATTIFLMITVKGKVTYSISTDPRLIIEPMSLKSVKSRQINKIKTQFLLGNKSYSETIKEIETALVDSLIDEHGGNISAAARASSMDRGMIYRKRTKKLNSH